jgi:hypothetical protein
MTLGHFALKKPLNVFIEKDNNHGVDVSMIIIIQLRHIKNNNI